MIKRRLHSSQRVALVPNQWSGSVQQYYHFLLGYLAPILRWVDKTGHHNITVRDCGPMNRWFDAVLTSEDVDIMQVGHFLHVFAGKLQPCVVLRGMDFPDEFDGRQLQEFQRLVLRRLGIDREETSRTTVITRETTDPFYSSAESEIDLAGAARRSTPNLRAWVQSRSGDDSWRILDTTELPVRDQVDLFSSTRVLIGQHGAGLTNMVFMKPGGIVVEIQPPLPREAVETFTRLAAACQHRYIRVPQPGVHSDIDVEALDAALSNL